jgi:hypothetical protein
MYRKDTRGDHIFEGERTLPGERSHLEVYVFTRENFEKHEFRHRISDAKALQKIEETIFDPDRITTGPKPASKRNFYRVSWHKDGRNGERMLMLWRAYCFKKGNRYYIIATAFEGATSIANAIHYLEKDLWRKPGSKI